MPFKKGFDPNRNSKGRPKNAEIDELRAALAKEGLRKRKNFWVEVAQKAFTNPTIMIAIIKKFIPDLGHVEYSGDMGGKDTKLVIVYPPNWKPKEERNGLERQKEEFRISENLAKE